MLASLWAFAHSVHSVAFNTIVHSIQHYSLFSLGIHGTPVSGSPTNLASSTLEIVVSSASSYLPLSVHPARFEPKLPPFLYLPHNPV